MIFPKGDYSKLRLSLCFSSLGLQIYKLYLPIELRINSTGILVLSLFYVLTL